MRIGAIIQARMGSTRLPGKVMKILLDKTILEHVIVRVKQSKLIDEVIIATTTHDKDNVIENEALRCGAFVFRGSEDDVLSRYYLAAKEHNLDVVVRITSDCPLIDPIVLDEIIKFYLDNDFGIVSNAGSDASSRTYPRGLDTEVFSYEKLENAYYEASESHHREHVTPYIYEESEAVVFYRNSVDYSKYRWTLDTEEDFILISKIYNDLYDGKHDFYMQDIIKLFKQNPELYFVNAHIEQKKIK